MIRLGATACLAALILAGCAAGRADRGDADAAELAEVLAGRTAGQEAECISSTFASGPQIVGETLVYREGRRLWVNQPVGGCPSLRGDPIVITEQRGSQLCANDQFRTIERGGIGLPGPYCRLSPFVPYTETK